MIVQTKQGAARTVRVTTQNRRPASAVSGVSPARRWTASSPSGAGAKLRPGCQSNSPGAELRWYDGAGCIGLRFRHRSIQVGSSELSDVAAFTSRGLLLEVRNNECGLPCYGSKMESELLAEPKPECLKKQQDGIRKMGRNPLALVWHLKLVLGPAEALYSTLAKLTKKGAEGAERVRPFYPVGPMLGMLEARAAKQRVLRPQGCYEYRQIRVPLAN